MQRGFTLLELLVALAIFALIASAAYRSLALVLETQAAGERQAQRLAALQLSFSRLGRDLGSYLPRPVRDAWGDSLPALVGSADSLEFSHGGWRNPLQQRRSEIQRVRYALREGQLVRSYWPVLDRAPDSAALDTPLLDTVKLFSLRYLDVAGQWHPQWPPLQDAGHSARLQAVELTLELPDWGRLPRLFVVNDPPGEF